MTRTVAVGERPSIQKRESPPKRLFESEWQTRRAKDLCFKCDKKFTIDHQCKNHELRVLLVFDDEVEEWDEREEEIAQEVMRIEVAETIGLSLNSVVGLTTPGMMKVKGTINGKEVIILIDCGATHNFIAVKLVEDLQLPLVTINSYRVVMGTGVAVKGKGICWRVVLSMQGLTLVQDFLPLELGSTDVVLGMEWLGSLGRMEVNWKRLTMTFRMGNSLVVFQGETGLNKSGISLKTMVKEIKQGGQRFLVNLET